MYAVAPVPKPAAVNGTRRSLRPSRPTPVAIPRLGAFQRPQVLSKVLCRGHMLFLANWATSIHQNRKSSQSTLLSSNTHTHTSVGTLQKSLFKDLETGLLRQKLRLNSRPLSFKNSDFSEIPGRLCTDLLTYPLRTKAWSSPHS